MRLLRDLVGDTLSDRYRIVSRIAGGGMGEVYRAHDLLLDRTVAVKILMPSLANDLELVARFKAEARAAARLNHPNVVAVHDWGSEDERTYYMVMEFVSGTDLRDVIVGRGPMDPAHAIDIVRDVANALAAAHATGLIHRDVKPENVLIARDGMVKVADFGIAAIADAERTMPGGGIMGTLRYLAPEQAAGQPATALSDVWAAGALLFELLTGTPPHGGTGAELLRRRAEEPPTAPSTLERDVPVLLDDIVLKACAVDPQDRYDSAAALAVALSGARAELEPRGPEKISDLFTDLTDEIAIADMTTTGIVGRKSVKRKASRVVPRRALAGLVVLAVLVFGGWKAAGAIFGPKEVEVPALVGLTQDTAALRAEEAGFEIEIVDRERHPELEEGRIISQDPEDGLLLQGETLELVVSKGHPLVPIPDLVGVKEAKAGALLAELNLVVGETTYEFSIEQPQGAIIEVLAIKGRVEEGTSVDLVVSKGPESIELPDVVGMSKARASETLLAAGFTPVFVDVYSEDVKEGRVVSMDPPGGDGAEAPEAGEIEVAISIGPEYEEFRMPDVRNMNVDEARALLESKGLIVVINQSCPGSTVIDSDPSHGTTVRENDKVVLFVC